MHGSLSSPGKYRALSGALSHCEYLQGASEAWLKTGTEAVRAETVESFKLALSPHD